jgi:hypothetical protein
MTKKWFTPILIIGLLVILGITSCNSAPIQSTRPTQVYTPQVVIQTPSTPLPMATAYAQEPAAGICASFDGEMVVVSINPDIPDPRCSRVRPDQKLTIINSTQNDLEIHVGNAFEADLAPGEKTMINHPFSDYLYPGVHQVDVKPCCGFELWLEETK